jgi:hypothetical protein
MDFNDINYLYKVDKHLEKTCTKVQKDLTLWEVECKTRIHVEVLNLIKEKISLRAVSLGKMIEKPK